MQVDLPALDRPTKAISGMSSAGKWKSSAAVVRKRAVCIQPMGVMGLASKISGVGATFAGAFLGRVVLGGLVLGVDAGLFGVAIRVKLSGHLK